MKNLFETISLRRARLTFTILFLIVLAICTVNSEFVLFRYATSNDQCAWREIPGRDTVFLITDVVPGGVTDKAGIKNGDILLRINGIKFTTNILDTSGTYPMNIVNSIPRGEFASYLIERDGRTFETKVEMLKVFDYVYASNYLFGLVFLVVGYIVVITKPRGKTQRMFAYFTISMMLVFGLSNLSLANYNSNIFVFVIIICVTVISRIIGPSLIVNFFYYFPVYKKTRVNRIILYSIAGLNAVIVLSTLVFPRQYAYMNFTIRIGDVYVFRTIIQNLVYLYFIAGLSIFLYRYLTLIPKDRRKPLTPILYCSLIGISAYIYTLLVNLSNQFTIFLNPENLLQYALITLIPLSFGYSIFKYRLMDIKLFLKKGLVYGIITAMLAVLYVLLVFIAGEVLGSIISEDKKAPVSILAIVIIAFVFDPLKRLVQDYVDRFFYREKSDYQKVLLDLTKSLPMQINKDRILNSVADTISGSMHLDKVAVVLFDENGGSFVGRNISEDRLQFNGKHEKLKNFLEMNKEPQSVSVLREECICDLDNKDIAFLSEAGIEIAVPVMFHDKIIGIINAGKKLSEKDYSQEDIDLLMTVANHTAIAVENSRLHDKERSFYQIQHEIELASKIQLEWLPKSNPAIPGFEIHGITKPAKVVGGDYFDYIEKTDNMLGVCLGDVSGKGLPAALLMANLQAVLRTQALVAESTAECIEQTNKLLYSRTSDNMFVTLFYSVLDISNSVLHYTNAGHNYPVIIKQTGEQIELKAGGMILGINSESKYVHDKILLNTNDILMIYSDGITEQFNPQGYMFGESRLISLVKNNRHNTASELSDLIFDNVMDFKGDIEISDDMTLVILKKL